MSHEIEQIELSIEDAQKMVDRKAQLEKLFSNREFRKLIEEGYFKDEAARLVSALSDPVLEPHREKITRSIEGIGALQQYFRTILRTGDAASQAIVEAREALAEIRADEEALEGNF